MTAAAMSTVGCQRRFESGRLAGKTKVQLPSDFPSMTVAGVKQQAISVVTRINLSAQPEEVWKGLMFYEQIEKRPALLLRLALPVPMRTEGGKWEVGNEVKCHYLGGHLLKRVTQITRGRNYAFEIIEQHLTIGGGIRLLGGSYTLCECAEGRTQVALNTWYLSPNRPRWLWERTEAAVCHSFHRYILSAMRDNLQSP
jgi:hypothetical protein